VIEPEVFQSIANAERDLPYVRTWDLWGHRIDEVVLSHGWQVLNAKAVNEG
jgi:hypothetical protein